MSSSWKVRYATTHLAGVASDQLIGYVSYFRPRLAGWHPHPPPTRIVHISIRGGFPRSLPSYLTTGVVLIILISAPHLSK